MKVLMIGLNYAPEPIGTAIYTTGLAEVLAARGHTVKMLAGRPYYPDWALSDGHGPFTITREVVNGVHVTRLPHYVPAKPGGLQRLLHHASFAAMATGPMAVSTLTMRPDLVIAIAPSIMSTPLARLGAMLGRARSWLHVQDFELDAAVGRGLLPRKNKLLAAARRVETLALSGFDTVSTISAPMRARLTDKGVAPDRAVLFPNWADIGDRVSHPAMDYRAEFGITTPHVALYSGSLGRKQNIDIVIAAARRLRHRKDITFVICGQGPERRRLEDLAGDLANIKFCDLQPAEHLPDLLALASVHLLPQSAGAADLVLPSKLANMLASGRPIVTTAAPDTGLSSAVNGCGLVTSPGDPEAFASAIAKLTEDGPLAAELGTAGRRRAAERWNRNRILEGVCTRMEALAEHRTIAGAELKPAIADD